MTAVCWGMEDQTEHFPLEGQDHYVALFCQTPSTS